MENTIIYLIGFAGTGKYTIAQELCKESDIKLVDNHLINNPVFAVVGADGKTPLPDSVWVNTWKIRHIVLDSIRDISPKDFSFVFTNCLYHKHDDDYLLFQEIVDLAEHRNAQFVPVRLGISEDELVKRRTSEQRKDRMKDTSAENARREYNETRLIDIEHKNLLDLDVTEISATDAAKAILTHIKEMQ